MSQSAFIAGMLLAGFVLFIATEGRLNVYVSILAGSGSAGANNLSSGSGGGSSGGSGNDSTMSDVETAAEIAAVVAM